MKNNRIKCIKDSNGEWLMNQQDIAECFNKNFSNLSRIFHTNNPDNLDHLMEKIVIEKDNKHLTTIPTDDKI